MTDVKKQKLPKWEKPELKSLEQSLSDVSFSSFTGTDGDTGTNTSFS